MPRNRVGTLQIHLIRPGCPLSSGLNSCSVLQSDLCLIAQNIERRARPDRTNTALSACRDEKRAMVYRRTHQVVKRLAARRSAILTAARDAAAEGGMAAAPLDPGAV